jgi:hypothetical protein
MHTAVFFLFACNVVGFDWGNEVYSYEGNTFPEKEEWTRGSYTETERWIDEGWLFRNVQLCDGCPGPSGPSDTYRGLLTQYADVTEFFVEVVLETTGEADFIHTSPSGFVITNHLGASYYFVIGNDQVQFRRFAVPFVEIDIEPRVPHRYRLELYGDVSYVLFIDDELVDDGVPEAEFFPGFNPQIAFWASYYGEEHITRLDYIRFGPIPAPGSMDFDSDGLISWYDHFLFTDYLSGPDAPHARGWSVGDVDADSDIDLHDFAAMQNHFTGGE